MPKHTFFNLPEAKRNRIAIVLLFTTLLPAPAVVSAQELAGFAELRGQFNAGVDGQQFQVVERLRPTFTKAFSDRLALTASIDVFLAQGRNLQDEFQRTISESSFGPTLAANGYVWPEDANETLDVSRATDYLQVDRFYLDAYLKQVDLRLGRQPLNWGSALVVNPTDPFPQVLATQPWLPRAGVNAVRATVPFGERNQIQAVVGANDAFTAARVAARATVNVGLADLSLVGAYRQESETGIVGLDIRGTFGVGYWLEGAVHLRPAAAGDPYEEIAVGADYSFPVFEKLVVGAQYYRNGAGSQQAGSGTSSTIFSGIEGPTCSGCPPLFPNAGAGADPFAPGFRGRDYGMLSVNLSATPEVACTALWIQNLGDGSAMLVPAATWAPTGRIEISLAAQIPFSLWGQGGEFHPSAKDLELSIANGGTPATVDLSGLVPSAVITLWTRINY